MRRIVILLAAVFAAAAPVHADNGPVLVIPSRPGVPVIVNGVDVSYAVVHGDWGLYRPGAVPVSVSSGPLLGPAPVGAHGYFPRTGRLPRAGRLEVVPPADRPLPPPAETYYRSWSTNDFGPPPSVSAPNAPVTTSLPQSLADEPAAQSDPRDRKSRRGRQTRDSLNDLWTQTLTDRPPQHDHRTVPRVRNPHPQTPMRPRPRH